MGTYQVLARKWRPQNFDQLVGQRHVAQTLSNAIESGRLAHAYLFSGLRGTGKTTVARILAKCLNCEQGPTVKPCDRCDACREIMESRAIDVLEIDAASRTKVDQTREMLEMISYAPVRDRNKILIIDEAHMLSKQSFNALLKTLEEPPPNVIFVLATTELQKVLPTILSRCQVFEFRRVATAEVAGHLANICKAESIRISAASMDRIARAGEGSVRDSLTVLERVLAFCGNEVDDEAVLRLLGAVNANVLADTVAALAARDAGALLAVLDGLVDEGHDLLHFWNELVAALRDLLFMDAVGDRPELLSRPPEEAERLEAAAKGLSREDLTRAFQIVADLEPALKSSSQPRFMFEATLIRLAGLGAVRPIEELLQAVQDGGAGLASPPPSAQKKSLADAVRRSAPPTPRPPLKTAAPRVPAAHREKAQAEPPRPSGAVTRSGSDSESGPAPRGKSGSTATASAPRPTGAGGLRADLQARVRAARPMLGAVLDQAQAVELNDDEVVLRFRDEDASLSKTLARDESLALMRKLVKEIAGRKLDVRIAVGEDAPTRTAGSRPAASRPRITRAGLIERARQDPGVKKLLREFGAQVIEIHPMADRGVRNDNQEDNG